MAVWSRFASTSAVQASMAEGKAGPSGLKEALKAARALREEWSERTR